MLGIMVAKWVADYMTHSLNHALLELKCMPFLENQLPFKTRSAVVIIITGSSVLCHHIVSFILVVVGLNQVVAMAANCR